MTAMSVTDARTRMGEDLLDDKNNRRWTTTQLDRHLKAALSKCVTKYAKEGGHRFTRKLAAQATTTAGILALSSYDPLLVLGVQLIDGDRRERLGQCEPYEVEYVDTEARSIDVHLVPNVPWDGTTLVATTDVLGTWDAFDEWVVAKAALDASFKDKTLYNGLQRIEADAAEAVLGLLNVNASPDFPQKVGAYDYLRWTVVGTNLQLARNYGHDYGMR